MKYYKNPSDTSVWGYEANGSQDAIIPSSYVSITLADVMAIQAAKDAAAAIAAVPQVVTAFQAKAAIYNAGLLPQVQAAVTSAPMLVQLAWTDTTEFTRDSPTVAALSSTLGLTSVQVDALFKAAAVITA